MRRTAQQAKQDTVPRWVPIANGMLFSSLYAFYVQTSAGEVHRWPWEDITSASMDGPGSLRFTAKNHDESAVCLLASDWAELVFVTWALARHPRHPDLLNGGWLPSGWVEHARAFRQDVPAVLTKRA